MMHGSVGWWRAASGEFYMASLTAPAEVYRIEPDLRGCSCAFSFWKRAECKHIRQLRREMDYGETEEANTA